VNLLLRSCSESVAQETARQTCRPERIPRLQLTISHYTSLSCRVSAN